MDEQSKTPKYPHNILEGFGSGCLLDLRVRMAMNFMQQSPAVAEVAKACMVTLPKDQVHELPMWTAKFALECATELLRLGAEKGWVEPLPDPSDVELNEQLCAQAVRTATYQVLQQIEGQKFAQREQAGQLIPVAPVVPRRGH